MSKRFTRVVNKRHDQFDVDICRPGIWGNPFVIGVDGTRAEVILKHYNWIKAQPKLMLRLSELQGKTLGCVCKPQECHGDNLAYLADTPSLW